MNKKAMSQVMAITMLIGFAILTFIGFFNWFTSYSTLLNAGAEEETKKLGYGSQMENIVSGFLYFTNTYEKNLSITSLKIDGVFCSSIEPTFFETGFDSVNISDCVSSLSSIEYEVVLVTPERIFVDDLQVN